MTSSHVEPWSIFSQSWIGMCDVTNSCSHAFYEMDHMIDAADHSVICLVYWYAWWDTLCLIPAKRNTMTIHRTDVSSRICDTVLWNDDLLPCRTLIHFAIPGYRCAMSLILALMKWITWHSCIPWNGSHDRWCWSHSFVLFVDTAQKSHYPPGNHHASSLLKRSYFQVVTTC